MRYVCVSIIYLAMHVYNSLMFTKGFDIIVGSCSAGTNICTLLYYHATLCE